MHNCVFANHVGCMRDMNLHALLHSVLFLRPMSRWQRPLEPGPDMHTCGYKTDWHMDGGRRKVAGELWT